MVRSSGAMSLSSAATSSGRHGFQQRILVVGRQIVERRGGFLARQDPEDEHLILESRGR